jgi:hypothetical protein
MAVTALCDQVRVELLLPQLPLHEGRRKRVLRSGCVEDLSTAKPEAVRRGFGSHRERPRNRAVPVPDEKQKVSLEISQELNDQRH